MIRDAQIPIRTTAEIRDALGAAAEADRRSMASMVEMIVVGWLTDRGFLPAPATRKAPASAKPKRQPPNPTPSLKGITDAQVIADEAKDESIEARAQAPVQAVPAKRKAARPKP